MQSEAITNHAEPVKAFTACVGTAIALACSGVSPEDFYSAIVDIVKVAKHVHDKNILDIHPGVGHA